MGIASMRKLKIGYWPLTSRLNTPGDRRRLLFWANSRGHTVITDLDQKVDVIVASENADFNSKIFKEKNVPIIFDLVDAYLSPLNDLDDLARGIAKHVSGQISGSIKPFSQHIKNFCLNSNAVICSSVEQEAVIKGYNINTHVILDSHEEIPFMNRKKSEIPLPKKHRILWEGQPATIMGVKNVSLILSELARIYPLKLDFVTDETYFQILNRYFERKTYGLLEKNLGSVINSVSIFPWTLENLVSRAKLSDLAMIPIDLSIPMQRLKPENRLLIMWRLGLPCVTSPSPAYMRVSHMAGVTVVSNNPAEWFEKFSRLLNDPKFAIDEILAGQNYLRENHNESIILKKWDIAFESVTG